MAEISSLLSTFRDGMHRDREKSQRPETQPGINILNYR